MLKDLLELIKSEDEKHYSAMEKLVTDLTESENNRSKGTQ